MGSITNSDGGVPPVRVIAIDFRQDNWIRKVQMKFRDYNFYNYLIFMTIRKYNPYDHSQSKIERWHRWCCSCLCFKGYFDADVISDHHHYHYYQHHIYVYVIFMIYDHSQSKIERWHRWCCSCHHRSTREEAAVRGFAAFPP